MTLLPPSAIRPKYLLIFMAIGLAACGFHMRGTQSITAANISSLNLRSVAARELTREVLSQLQLAGLTISADADYTLSVEQESYQRSILSVSPRTGKAEEFQLTLTARMSLSRTGADDLISNELVSVSRDYLFDEDALLGKASEENVLRENLRRQAAADIIRRMHATINRD